MRCRACGTPHLPVVADLGSQRLPDFGDFAPPYPSGRLRLVMCPHCTLVQLPQEDVVPRDALYHGRYGFRSGISEAVQRDLVSVVHDALCARPRPKSWLDIACNDGTLLSYVPETIERHGIDPLINYAPFGDPASHVTKHLVGDYFSPGYYDKGQFDVVTSVSMMYDLDDPSEFACGVRDVLAPDGVWVIQMNYSLDMIRNNAIDNVGHEHITYFGVRPLQTMLYDCGLEIFDVSYSGVNGGCFRALAGHKGRHPVNPGSFWEAAYREIDAGLDYLSTWESWYRSVRRDLGKLLALLNMISDSGERCYLYGASTRIGTVLQLIDAGPELIQYAVERNPDKVGKTMLSTLIPVISEEEMRADPPEWMLIGPWFFRDVFVQRELDYLRKGGKFILPLPHFEVVQG